MDVLIPSRGHAVGPPSPQPLRGHEVANEVSLDGKPSNEGERAHRLARLAGVPDSPLLDGPWADGQTPLLI